MSQSVPRDGGYCNETLEKWAQRNGVSQSVPRDGGYCNRRSTRRLAPPTTSQSVPRDGGYCNTELDAIEAHERCLNPSRGTGGTATVEFLKRIQGCVVSIRPEGRGVLQPGSGPGPRPGHDVSIRPEGRGVLQPRSPAARRAVLSCLNPSRGTGGTATRTTTASRRT